MTNVDNSRAVAHRGAPARATIADVARLAGVSLKTASRALGDSPNVKASTRTKVLDAAAALRFRPNSLARDLRSGGVATTLGFVIGDLTNPFYALVATGVSQEANERGVTVVMAASDDDPGRERPTVTSMLERRVLALLLVPIAEDHSYLEGERQLGTPIVAVDRPLAHAASDSVVFDNRTGARDGTRALIVAGHRRIAFVGSSQHLYTHGERARGYRDALEGAGIPFDEQLVMTNAPTVDSATAATMTLLRSENPPTAIFAGNNRATVGVHLAIAQSGADVSLIGFDDFEFAEALGISVVAHSPVEMGRVAADLAFRRLDSINGPLEHIVLPTTLVLRHSHARAAG
ncbi:LacI family DNA-binding transcriptional regulator [Microcella sp.]|uniref:LacI family DNA-binding transcriptional regulator n=1 Tax=Microcella sp. TaxID=1913979 RepID=UPI003F6F3F35